MKGILFKPDMIKAIREGRKTITRRVIPLKGYSPEVKCIPHNGKDARFLGEPYLKVLYDPVTDNAGTRIIARYQVGDIVYIKEAWAVDKAWDDKKPSEINKLCSVYYFESNKLPLWVGRKRSPLFMPAWAARDFIQITDVRAERLQEITEKDALAEGIEPFKYDLVHLDLLPIQKYQRLWDSINKEYPWASNPWCWRYEFKRVANRDGKWPTVFQVGYSVEEKAVALNWWGLTNIRNIVWTRFVFLRLRRPFIKKVECFTFASEGI